MNRRGRDRMEVGYLQLSVQSVPITTKVFQSIQHYVIKLAVINLRQVCGFLRVLRFPPPIKQTSMI